MAKKSVTKSKPATKQLVKKYQFAGANSSTYQQVANPYYISGTFSQQSAQEADRAYAQAISLGDFAAAQQIKAEADRKRLETQEKQAKEEMLDQAKALKEQEVAGYGQQVANAAGDQGLAFAKEKLGERAAKKAAEKTATDALANAGSTAANVASTGANTVAQSVAPTLSIQAARGSGMEAARAATSLIDDTGAVVLPQAANTGANVGAGVGSAAATGASTAANTGLMAANMSGLASAGIGLGLTGAGMLVQRKMDTDPTKYSKKEGRQNAWGDALKGAGTGFGLGATAGTIVPGVGNVVGGIVGGLAGFGIGLAKGIKENRKMQGEAGEYAAEEAQIAAERAEAERKRLAELNKQGNLLANRYNTAFVNSRLTGLQTGFGYNTSPNMNMQPTSSFYAETGGARVPGGQIVPIKGSDAVEFVGKKHSEGGIKIDPQTEVEGGETMDKVMMNGGKPNDYFFSSYLKLGGKSFARRHKEILKAGGSQKQIQDLAKMQEAVANKKGEKDRGPEQIAKYGGIHQYKMAGPEQSAMAQSNMDAANVTLRDVNQAAANAPSSQQSAAPGKRTTNSGMLKQYEKGGKKQLPPKSLNYIDSTPWSSAFISYVYSNADPNFPKSPTHTGYATGLKGRDDWEELDPASTKLQPGDIIVNNRSGNKQKFGQDSYSGFSHGDIVTKIDGDKVYAIGGNVDPDNVNPDTPDTVAERSKSLKDGILADSGYFVVLRPKNPQIAQKAVEVATNEKQLWETNKWNEHADTSQSRLQTYYQSGKLGIPGVAPDDGKPASASAKKPDDGFKLVSEPGYMGSIRTYYYNPKTGERRNNPMSDAEQQAAFEAKQAQDANVRNIGLGVGMAVPAGLRSVGVNLLGQLGREAVAPNTGVAKPGPLPGLGGGAVPKPGTGVTPYTGPGTGVGSFTGNIARPGQAYDAVPVSEVGPYLGKDKSGITINVPALGPKPGYPTASLLRPEMPDNTAQRAAEFTPTPFTVTPAADGTTVDPGTEGPFPPRETIEPIKSKEAGLLPTKKTVEADLTKDTGLKKTEKNVAPPRNRNINGALLAGLGQLIPVGYALFKGYKTEGNLPRMVGGGNVGAGSVKGAILPRVNMNAERASAERNTVAVKNAIQNTNAGPGGIAAMMAANTAQNNQSLEIANQEQSANKQLAAEEAKLGMQASMSNAEMAQRANMANVQNQLAVNQANLEAGIQEARLKLDEKRYKREEIIGALDTAAGRIAGIYKDDRSYKAQERLANAMDDAGSYQRFQYYEDLKKQAKDKDSEFYGKTDKELKDYAAQQYNDYIGANKTGGARKYTSRLGQLSKGKKTFNI
jgi:hypothetical protein